MRSAKQEHDLKRSVSRSRRVAAYQRFNLILPIFGVGFLVGLGPCILVAELSRAKRAQRSTMGKKICKLCIQEILVLRKSSVRSTSVLEFTPSCKPK